MSEWIKVKNDLPNDDDCILMITNNGDRRSGKGRVLISKLEAEDRGCGYRSEYYTHWMLYPKLPEE